MTMYATKHSVGDWELIDIAVSDDRTKQQIVANGRGVMMLSHDGSAEGLANAVLMTKASKLFEACAFAADNIRGGYPHDAGTVLEKLEAALDEATSEPFA
jgi:hypothetical protein